MPQESPFQASYPDFSPYCQTNAIAIILFSIEKKKQTTMKIKMVDRIERVNKIKVKWLVMNGYHSTTLETWTAQVGKERALEGSWSSSCSGSWIYEEVVSTMLRKWERPAFGFKVPPNRQLLCSSSLELDRNGILGVQEHGFDRFKVVAAMVLITRT